MTVTDMPAFIIFVTELFLIYYRPTCTVLWKWRDISLRYVSEKQGTRCYLFHHNFGKRAPI